MSAQIKTLYEFNGEMLTSYQIAKINNINVGTLTSRLLAGWSVDDATNKVLRAKGVNAGYSKGDVDNNIAEKTKKDKSDFNEFGGFAQCSGRINSK